MSERTPNGALIADDSLCLLINLTSTEGESDSLFPRLDNLLALASAPQFTPALAQIYGSLRADSSPGASVYAPICVMVYV